MDLDRIIDEIRKRYSEQYSKIESLIGETIQNEISQKGLKTVLEKNYDGLKSSDIPERIKQYLDVEPSSPNNEDVDVVGYFKERLVGTRCELNSDANIDTIKRLVNQLGQKEYDERYSQIKPAKKRPEKTDEFIIDLGLKKILRFPSFLVQVGHKTN